MKLPFESHGDGLSISPFQELKDEAPDTLLGLIGLFRDDPPPRKN